MNAFGWAALATQTAALLFCFGLFVVMGRQKRADDQHIADQDEWIYSTTHALHKAHEQIDEHREEVCDLRAQNRRLTRDLAQAREPLPPAKPGDLADSPIFAALLARSPLALPAGSPAPSPAKPPSPPLALPSGDFLVEPDLILQADS